MLINKVKPKTTGLNLVEKSKFFGLRNSFFFLSRMLVAHFIGAYDKDSPVLGLRFEGERPRSPSQD